MTRLLALLLAALLLPSATLAEGAGARVSAGVELSALLHEMPAAPVTGARALFGSAVDTELDPTSSAGSPVLASGRAPWYGAALSASPNFDNGVSPLCEHLPYHATAPPAVR